MVLQAHQTIQVGDGEGAAGRVMWRLKEAPSLPGLQPRKQLTL